MAAAHIQVVVDCADPHVLAEWWADALGWVVEESDPAFIRRMIAEGHATEADTTTYRGVLVWKTGSAIRHPDDPSTGPRRRILFQHVPEPKTVKNRVHVDVFVGQDRVESERDRLVARGATFLHWGHEGPHRWATIADPEGNELCLV